MTTIRITHPCGVGPWAPGETVTLEDRHARKLTGDGYAVEVTDPKRVGKKKE